MSVEVVAGYSTYIDLIRPLIDGKEIISTGMTQEVKRVEKALETALSGKSCAIVSSGDPGIYAMAGLIFETCETKGIFIVPPGTRDKIPKNQTALTVEIIPGIPALSAGAALLGGLFEDEPNGRCDMATELTTGATDAIIAVEAVVCALVLWRRRSTAQ